MGIHRCKGVNTSDHGTSPSSIVARCQGPVSNGRERIVKQAIDERLHIDDFPQFFPGSRVNFAENMLCRRQNGTAVLDIREDNLHRPERYSWNDLRELVRRYSNALRASGAKKGDIVARMWLSLPESTLASPTVY